MLPFAHVWGHDLYNYQAFDVEHMKHFLDKYEVHTPNCIIV